MKISLFLLTQKGFEVLKVLQERHPSLIDIVISSRDKGVLNDYFDEIRQFCYSNSIPFSHRQDNYKISTPYAFAVGWRWVLDLVDAPLIVFHDSLLPRYRGFNPLVSCLINGENKVGVTALFASDDYDTGDILAQESSNIEYPIKIQQAIDQVCQHYISLACTIADKICEDQEIAGFPQDHSRASYSLWRDEKDYFINWFQSSSYISRFIDAVGPPYQGALTNIDTQYARVMSVMIYPDVTIENRDPGKVIFVKEKKYPVVVCGQGLVKITSLLDVQTGESILPLNKFRNRFE